MKPLLQVTLLAALGVALYAQNGKTYDASGNSLLQGAYNFRHLAATVVGANGNPTEVTATYGVITFDGNGNYSLAGNYVDNTVASGAPQKLSIPSCATNKAPCGNYAIGANGIGYIANPLAPGDASNVIRGAVARGMFAGSDTESTLLLCPGNSNNTCSDFDIFVAIPVGTLAGNASLTAPYQVALLDFAGANSAAIKNALANLTPNGPGTLGTMYIHGQASNQADVTNPDQYLTAATYQVNADSSVTVTLPLPVGVSSANAMFAGTRTMFVSADGNYVLGWTPSGFDIFVGVKNPAQAATQSNMQGLYFIAGLEDSPTGAGVDAFYGSISASGDANGDAILHQRLKSTTFSPTDYVADDQIQLNAGNAGDYNGYQYSFGANGAAFIAVGSPGAYGLMVGLQSAKFSGQGVFLNPIGVVNAASYAPVTAGLAPGELVTMFGTNLASGNATTQGGQPFPTSLGGVQVSINGFKCPIYYVSPTQISVIVPYELGTTGTFLADIQVSNNSVLSNIVQMYWQASAPGVFSQNQNGIGYGAVLHAKDGTLVSTANPARAGEYIEVFLTGLGKGTPAVADGALGPSDQLSSSDEWTGGNLFAFFNDYTSATLAVPAIIQYAGLAPGLAGLFQMNVQVPSELTAGDTVYFEIQTEVGDMNQILIPVG